MGRRNPYRHPLGRRCGDPRILLEGAAVTELPKTAAQDMSTDPAVVEWHKTLSEAFRVHEQSTLARLRQVEAELHDALRRAADLEQVREELKQAKFCIDGYLMDTQDLTSERDEARAQNAELLSEVAEIRAQLERAVGQAEKLRGYWAESSRHRAEIQDRLTRVEADATARQVELTSAYHELGDVAAERDRLSRDLAGAVIARHEAERELASTRSWQVAGQDAGVCIRCGGPIVRGQAVEPQPGTTKGSFAHVHCPEPEEAS